MAFAQPQSGGSLFSGYFSQLHQNVYGPQQGPQEMNTLMLNRQSPQFQTQPMGSQRDQEEGPLSQIADAYSMYDKAKSAASMFGSSTPIASSSTGSAAYGGGAGVYPVAAEGTGLWAGADMGASTMTGFTPAAGSTTVGGTAGSSAAGTSGGTAAGTAAGEAGAGAGYGAAGWYALLAGLGANAVHQDWYDTDDIWKGTAPSERWNNMQFFSDIGDTFETNWTGSDELIGSSSRMLSPDPTESLPAHEDFTKSLNRVSKDVARQNFEGAKQFSNTTLVKPLEKSVEFTKKTLNPFKWFD